jgi:uncharacterized protein (TIGR02594 family)
MDFNSIKTASLGAFAITILGTTAFGGTAYARPYENGSDWNANGWRNYSTNVEFNGWAGEPDSGARSGRVRHGRKHVSRRHRAADVNQAASFDANRYGSRNPDASPYAVQYNLAPKQGRRQVRARAKAQRTVTTGGFGGGDLVSEARRYLGGNPTGRSSLWCGAFMDLILQRTGHRPGSNLARDYAHYGTRISGPQVGAIAVMSRGKRGGHVGVVSGIDEAGNPIIISGNHGRRVAEATYSRGRVFAYVMP